MSEVTLTFYLCMLYRTKITYANVYERQFCAHMISLINLEIRSIANKKSYADHLESVVCKLEIDRLHTIVFKCAKIFSVEIEAYIAKKPTLNRVMPPEMLVYLELIQRTRITRNNISRRHKNTLECALARYRAHTTPTP